MRGYGQTANAARRSAESAKPGPLFIPESRRALLMPASTLAGAVALPLSARLLCRTRTIRFHNFRPDRSQIPRRVRRLDGDIVARPQYSRQRRKLSLYRCRVQFPALSHPYPVGQSRRQGGSSDDGKRARAGSRQGGSSGESGARVRGISLSVPAAGPETRTGPTLRPEGCPVYAATVPRRIWARVRFAALLPGAVSV